MMTFLSRVVFISPTTTKMARYSTLFMEASPMTVNCVLVITVTIQECLCTFTKVLPTMDRWYSMLTTKLPLLVFTSMALHLWMTERFLWAELETLEVLQWTFGLVWELSRKTAVPFSMHKVFPGPEERRTLARMVKLLPTMEQFACIKWTCTSTLLFREPVVTVLVKIPFCFRICPKTGLCLLLKLCIFPRRLLRSGLVWKRLRTLLKLLVGEATTRLDSQVWSSPLPFRETPWQ